MKFYCLSIFLLLAVATSGSAQGNAGTVPDTIISIDLPNHDVNADRIWHNDTARYRYNMLKKYVLVVLPFVNEGTRIFGEINTKLASPNLSHKERKRFLASKEKEIKENFEDKVKNLNSTQGVLLIKLIARQTGANLYEIIQESKGSFAAIKYQLWAKFNGFNLNRKYHPDEEPDLEHVMFSLGYPLPEGKEAAVQR